MSRRMQSRREFIRNSLVVSAAAGTSSVACVHRGARHARPNILFIYTDDQASWSLGCLGNTYARTPNLDKFASDAINLTNSFVVTPVCSPSRAGLLTSRYGTEVGITDWLCPNGGPFTRDESEVGLVSYLPTWVRELSDDGYDTTLVGKWHLGIQDSSHPRQFGYRQFLGFRAGGVTAQDPTLEIDGVDRQMEGLTDDILTQLALEQIRRASKSQPFLLSVHFRNPHSPWVPYNEGDAAAYRDAAVPVPEPDFPHLDTERVKKSMHDYMVNVTSIDRNVGLLLAELERRGMDDNTIVVFTSDNGYNIGQHGIIHKGNASWITNAVKDIPRGDTRQLRSNMFDTSLRVPAFIRWKQGLPRGRKLDRTITNLDWYKTLLALCGIQSGGNAILRGRDFSPLLRNEVVPWNDDLYAEYSQHHYTEAAMRTYRTQEWKLTRDFHNQ
ncbi:MAG: sulfatase-like hydrolase/transferase, partial [Candidatus Hydrogenedentales bacterium]